METVDLIMLAAGKGLRMGTSMPKQFLPLKGRPILLRTFDVFENVPNIGRVIMTCENGRRELCAQLLEEAGLDDVILVGGGATRHESVYRALQLVESSRVLIQNADMPFITAELINQMIATPGICVTPVKPSPYTVFRSTPQGSDEIPQQELNIISSPQLLDSRVALRCYGRANGEGYVGTNDVCVLRRYGYPVSFVPDVENNVKLTTETDYLLAEAIIEHQMGHWEPVESWG